MMPHALPNVPVGLNGSTHSAPRAEPTDFLSALRFLPPETLTDAFTDAAYDALLALELPDGIRAGLEDDDALADLIADFAGQLTAAIQGRRSEVRGLDDLVARLKALYPPHRWPANPIDEAALSAALYHLHSDRSIDEEGLTPSEALCEGLERWVRSADWLKEDGKYVPGALKFVQSRRWREHGQKTPDGRLALGDREAQRRRDAARQREKLAIAERIAAKLSMPAPEPSAEPFEVARQRLLDPNARPEQIEGAKQFILGVYGREILCAILSEHQSPTPPSSRTEA